ncbi:insulinase family protein [Vibrio fluminensis]|uniref:insulinase family protein n=1 Tax=Vibrio fluminensis TaxID=2783614 RepID=UPI001888B9DC|nr:insulinase family protein [Vibrio fluminensis]
MKGTFKQLASIDCTEGQIFHYQHPSGLSHHNLNLPALKRHVGVFLLNTPSFDDSGLAHALEHLVFRKSALFPDPQTLFQLNTFSDIEINASTLDTTTCFHFSAESETSLRLAIKYLLSGILAPRFNLQDIQQEVFNPETGGVIYHELCGYQSGAENQLLVQVLRGDVSEQRVHCHGGTTETINAITLEALYQYHAKYYQPSNITLLTSTNHPELIHSTIAETYKALNLGESEQLNTPKKIVPRRTPSDSQLTTAPVSLLDDTRKVFTWWFNLLHFASIKSLESLLKKQIAHLNGKLLSITNDCNSERKFALRVITTSSQIDVIHSALIKQLHALKVPSIPNYTTSGKFCPAINLLLSVYYRYLDNIDCSQSSSISAAITKRPATSNIAKLLQTTCNLGSITPLEPPTKTTSLHTLKQLACASNGTQSHTSTFKEQWREFRYFKLDKNVNANTLSDIVTKVHSIDTIPLESGLVINEQHAHVMRQLDHLISQHPSITNPSIPAVVTELYKQLNEKRDNKKLSSRCFKQLSATQIRKNRQSTKFNVMLTSVNLIFSELHSLCCVNVSEDSKLVAQIASKVISASSPFLAPRVEGACYSIGINYCQNSNALYLFSVFDPWAEHRIKRICAALTDIAKDNLYLELALALTKQQLEDQATSKLGYLSHQQQLKLNQMIGKRHDAKGLKTKLNLITTKVLADFIEQLGTTIAISK